MSESGSRKGPRLASGKSLPGPLAAELAGLEPPLPREAVSGIAGLFSLLREFRGSGISGFREPEALARRYFREALELRSFLPEGGPHLDVGSGGGTPALPLALTDSASRWTLLEPRRSAAAFLELAVTELELTSRVSVVRRPLQDYLNSSQGRDRVRQVRAVTLRAVRLRRVEWKGLARTLRAGIPVIWPSSRAARERAGIPDGLYRERTFPAARGIVWVGRPVPAAGNSRISRF